MANNEYREPQQAAREVGLRARQETRQERAVRRQVAEEIAEACERKSSDATQVTRRLPMGDEWWTLTGLARGWDLASKLAREIGTREAGSDD